MTKPNIFLLGSHSKRTPFAYPRYRRLFESYFRYTDSLEEADIIILGYISTFESEKDRILHVASINPGISICVCSEEPLWETTGLHIRKDADREESTRATSVYKIGTQELRFLYVSHNNALRCLEPLLPYYITTDDRFYIRYNNCYTRNYLSLSRRKLIDLWHRESIRQITFVFEKRNNRQKYDFSCAKGSIRGLSYYRSVLASALYDMERDKVCVMGQGWNDKSEARQRLLDWHLDKLIHCDQKSAFMSAIENTMHPFYMTEKLFDAYACQSIPIYVAPPRHCVNSIVPSQSFVNLYNHLDCDNPARLLLSLMQGSRDSEFLDKYILDQHALYSIFKSVDQYLYSRYRYCESISQRVLKYLGDS